MKLNRICAAFTLKRELALLRELTVIAHLRFGVDATIGLIMQRLLSFFDADSCVLLFSEPDSGPLLYYATRQRPKAGNRPIQVENADRFPLFRLRECYAEVYSEHCWPSLPWHTCKRRHKGYDPETEQILNLPEDEGIALADSLDVRSFVTAPLRYREMIRGRICLSSLRCNAFAIDHAVFLLQAVDQVLPVIENTRLVQRLISEAAQEERRRIARNIHDPLIQPYLGLKIGLSAAYERLQSEQPPGGSSLKDPDGKTGMLAALLARLIALTNDGIDEVRNSVYGSGHAESSETHLMESIHRYVRKFEGATGIAVKVVDRIGTLDISDRLTAEVFEITAMRLSDIHSHTQTQRAAVSLELADTHLLLRIENETEPGVEPVQLSAASICERAEALGGRAEVSHVSGWAIMEVEVPL